MSYPALSPEIAAFVAEVDAQNGIQVGPELEPQFGKLVGMDPPELCPTAGPPLG